MLKLQEKTVVKLVLQTLRKKESKYSANELCTTPKLHLVLSLLIAHSNSRKQWKHGAYSPKAHK